MKSLVVLTLLASVCAQIPGEMQSLTVTVGTKTRSFSLYMPTNWSASSPPVPLVLNWHGLTDNPNDQAKLSGANEYADLYGWAIAYPSGSLGSHNGGACCPTASTVRSKDVDFARALVEYVGKRIRILDGAIFTMGFSNGGFMSERLACEAADLFSAVGINAGRRGFGGDFQACNPSRPIPVVSIQGTLDALVPYNGNLLLGFPSFAKDLVYMQGHMGCDAGESPYVKNVTSTSSCALYTQCGAPDVYLEYCTVQRGDHSWFTAPDIDSTGYFFARFAEIAGIEPKPFLNLPKVTPNLPATLVPMP